MRRTFQVGKRPGRRAKLAATGHGAGAGTGARGLRTCIYRGQVGPTQRSSHSHRAGRSDRMQRGAVIGLAARGNVQCTHTHTRALTCSHTPTHMCTHAHSALTFILHAPPLMLTYMRALTSGSWLRFWRAEPPRLHLSMEPFSRPHITPQSARLCPRPHTWLPTESRALGASWQGHGGLRLWVEGREPQV